MSVTDVTEEGPGIESAMTMNEETISRKDFFRRAATLSAAAGLYTLMSGEELSGFPYEPYPRDDEMKTVVTSCAHNCGGRHMLVAHIKNDEIIRLSTDNGSFEGDAGNPDSLEKPQLRACLRGRSYRQRLNSDDRLLYPMIRKGKRGEGRFQRASWDAALDHIVERIVEIKRVYGETAILDQSYAGSSFGVLHKSDQINGLLGRFLGMFGSRTSSWSVPSYQGTTFSSRITFGTLKDGNDDASFMQSKLIILWGWNPAYTFHGGNTFYYLRKARQNGCRFVAVDPQYTDSAAAYDAWWIPIRPGTDAAMLAAMAYHIFDHNLQDQSFIDRFALGVDERNMPAGYEDHESFKDYIFGKYDGIPKTPRWASEITGVNAEDIVKLAIMYATTKPAALKASWAPGRAAHGEQYNRMAAALQTITGNIGIQGGSAEGVGKAWMPESVAYPKDRYSNRWFASIKSDRWAHSVIHYPFVSREEIGLWPRRDQYDGTIPNIRAVWQHGSNWFNQLTNLNKNIQAINMLDFIVSQEQTMTPSARFADVVLPAATHFERHDVSLPWYKGHYYIHRPKVVPPPGEAKTDFQIFTELAYRLEGHGDIKNFGQNYNPKATRDYFHSNEAADEEYLREWWENKVQIKQGATISWEEFKRRGVYKFEYEEPPVAFQEQILEGKPFPTPTGKIEIFSTRLARIQKKGNWAKTQYGREISPIPRWIEPFEWLGDDKVVQYPFHLVSPHPRWRTHTIFHNTDWLREVYEHEAIMNTGDAEKLGLKRGDVVEIYNERGGTVIPVKPTQRMMPGVLAVHEGAWMDLAGDSSDRAGNPDFLTADEPSPAGAFAYNTVLCNVRKTYKKHRAGWDEEQVSRSEIIRKKRRKES